MSFQRFVHSVRTKEAGLADFVDLDGPLLLAEDRVPGLTYRGSLIDPAPPELWG